SPMTLHSPGDRAGGRGHFLHELRATVAERSGRPALVHNGLTYSYAEIDHRTRRCAGWLQGLGVERGDRVGGATGAKCSFLAAHLGAIYSGATSLPLNPRFTRDELRYFLADSAARVAVISPGLRQVVEGLLPELPELRAIVDGDAAWEAPDGPFREPSVAEDDACLMLYSSGTTGRPKGVVHTHANLAASLHALRDCWRYTPD